MSDRLGGMKTEALLLFGSQTVEPNSLPDVGTTLGISGWERGKAGGAWCQPRDPVIWKVALYHSDNLSDNFARA